MIDGNVCPKCKEKQISVKIFYPDGTISYRCSDCAREEKVDDKEDGREEIH